MAKRKNTVTRWVGDVVDDTKDFVDDIIDRAADVEKDARKAIRKAADDDKKSKKKRNKKYDAELADLHAAITELSATVNALAEAQTRSNLGKGLSV